SIRPVYRPSGPAPAIPDGRDWVAAPGSDPSPVQSIRVGVRVRPRPVCGPTLTSFGWPDGVPTSRRSAVTGSSAAVRAGAGRAATGVGIAVGAAAGTVSNDIQSTRPKP